MSCRKFEESHRDPDIVHHIKIKDYFDAGAYIELLDVKDELQILLGLFNQQLGVVKQLHVEYRNVCTSGNSRRMGDKGVSHSQLALAERKVKKYEEQAGRLLCASGSARDAVGTTQEAFAPG